MKAGPSQVSQSFEAHPPETMLRTCEAAALNRDNQALHNASNPKIVYAHCTHALKSCDPLKAVSLGKFNKEGGKR
jgi:hypothetical protein